MEDFSFWYGRRRALHRVWLAVPAGGLLVLAGPAGSGKTTLLRCINRLSDLAAATRRRGRILLDGCDVWALDPVRLRRRVGMVFDLPTPLPLSIYANVAYGPRLAGLRRGRELDERVASSLRRAALWPEVKDRLEEPAARLSGGQQQRLAIARVLAVQPEVILLDEPTASLDPVSTRRLETLLAELRREYTIVLATHDPGQAARMEAPVASLVPADGKRPPGKGDGDGL